MTSLRVVSDILARKSQKIVDAWAARHWRNSPFGTEVRADTGVYESLWAAERLERYPGVDAFEAETGFAIAKEWLDDLALHTQVVVKTSQISYQHGRVLYSALRHYLRNIPPREPVNIVETGTARGFSSAVMAKALHEVGQHGKIITFDVLPHHTRMFWNCIDDNECQKTRQELLAPWKDVIDPYLVFVEGCSRVNLPKIQLSRVHFAFLDGGHDYEDVSFEMATVAQRQQTDDVIVCDDYNPDMFPGVVRAVDEACERWGYSRQLVAGRNGRGYVVARRT